MESTFARGLTKEMHKMHHLPNLTDCATTRSRYNVLRQTVKTFDFLRSLLNQFTPYGSDIVK